MKTPRSEVGASRRGPQGQAWACLGVLLALWAGWPAVAWALVAATPLAHSPPLASGKAAAETLEAEQAWAGQRERLLEVLARDTDRALAGLETESQHAAPIAATPPAPPTPPNGQTPSSGAPANQSSARLRLRGLYGIEPSFTVLLEVDGVMKLYRPGASLPLNGLGAEHEFRLLRVQDRCVVLRLGGARPRTACYHNPLAAPLSSNDQPWAEGLKAPLPDFALQ